jgi:hypothetical protein
MKEQHPIDHKIRGFRSFGEARRDIQKDPKFKANISFDCMELLEADLNGFRDATTADSIPMMGQSRNPNIGSVVQRCAVQQRHQLSAVCETQCGLHCSLEHVQLDQGASGSTG